MKQQLPCDDKTLLIAYLYDECDADERRFVAEHLATCATCAAELDRLRGVRGVLREWAPPEQALGFRVVREEATVVRPSRWWNRGLAVPAWAQMAAAVLLLVAGASIASLGARRDAPSAADFARLERRLARQEQQISALGATPVPRPVDVRAPVGPTPAIARVSAEDRAALMRSVQALVGDLERRQQREIDRQIAERFLRLAHDVDTQRVADQRRFLQGLNQIDLRTTQMSQVQNYLLRNVANVQIK